jgi:adenylate cyclase
MKAIRAIAATVWGGLIELVRPGESTLSGRELMRVGRVVIAGVIVITNLIGACAVLGIALFVVPTPPISHPGHVRLVNAIVAGVYVAAAVPIGVVLGTLRLLRLRSWLIEERPATLDETRTVLHAPLRLFALQVSLWLAAAVLFGALNLTYSSKLAIRVAIIVSFTGVVTASCAYLLTELLFRPAAARALASASPGRLVVPGVATRAVLAWMLGTGIPVFGVVAIGILALGGDRGATEQQLGVAMVALGEPGSSSGYSP